MNFNETEFGFEMMNENVICFFGKHNSDIQKLYKNYPLLDWASLKQIHSDKLVQCLTSKMNYAEADAHWTIEKNCALITRTADCIPIMGWNSATGCIISIHAGWKGIANQIVPKSLNTLSSNNPIHFWHLWVGPHIMKNSFQIQKDTLDLLEKSTVLSSHQWISTNENSLYADLSVILDSQLQATGVNPSTVYKCFFDTKSDLRFHSFRRDHELSGRQISFIAKI
jgi:YfiH family protein